MLLPNDSSDLEEIRTEKRRYVNKTAHAWNIANGEAFTGEHLLFIRPRRFGKSMLLTRLKAYYEVLRG
eukprot:gene11781-biopygen8529